MEFTGERYVPHLTDAQISYEHWHRYLYVSKLVAGKTVLDVACGEGYGSYLLALHAKQVVGVDIHDDTIQFASSKYLRHNLTFATARAGDLPSEWTDNFDMIVSYETIEHLDEPEQNSFLHEVKRLLKPHGSFIVSTPNKLTYSYLPEYSNEFHVKELYIKEFQKLLEEHFRNVRMLGQKVYPVSYMWDLGGEVSRFEDFEIAYSQTGFHPSDEPKPFVYAIAVCSDDEIAVPSNSVLVDVSEQLIKERDATALEYIRDRERVIGELQDQVKVMQSEFDSQMKHVESMYAAQIEEKEAAIHAHATQIEEAARAFQVQSKEATRALQVQSKEAAALRTLLDQQEQTLTRLGERLNEKEQTEGELRVHSDYLATQLAQKERAIQELQGSVSDWEAHWVIVQNTRAWKLASKVRRVRALSQSVWRILRLDPRLIARRLSMRLPVPTHTMVLHIDEPLPDVECSSVVRVRGWALSTRMTIARVEAWLDGLPSVVLTYGTPRPDVAKAFSQPNAASCGYVGSLDIQAVQPGVHELTVRASDIKGSVIKQSRRIVIAAPDPTEHVRVEGSSHGAFLKVDAVPSAVQQPQAQVERACWDGNHLEVIGWAVLPAESNRPKWARILIADACVGETRIHLARPDIGRRYTQIPGASRSGFRFFQRVPLDRDELHRTKIITVECADAQRVHIRIRSQLAVENVDSDPISTDVWLKIEDVLATFEEQSSRFPSVLDWNTQLHLAEAFPTHTVLGPPSNSSRLPYLDGSIDVVVTGAHNDFTLNEARRVASAAVVSLALRAGSDPVFNRPNSECSVGPSVEWLSNQRTPTSVLPTLPSTSIIIPVHNNVSYTEACLKRLIETLPRGFSGEIIVVDDASTDETPQILDHWAQKDGRIRALRNPKSLGFLLSCNRGADAATQEVLVFVNNDTLAQRDWLPPLLRILRDHKEVGAVGGKLVYPNGTLQEAGGIIFSDGSGYNFGKSDPNVDAPLYNHVREVDYCSGALLATWRPLWKKIGGFDTRFVPAYYEDTDYCFSVRKQGYKVCYQPESVVVHFEGVSSGTNIESGIKRYQAVNQAKFVEKWARELTAQPPPPGVIDHAALQRWAVREEQFA